MAVPRDYDRKSWDYGSSQKTCMSSRKLDKVIKLLKESELFDGGGDQGEEQSGESDWNSEEEEEGDGAEYNWATRIHRTRKT